MQNLPTWANFNPLKGILWGTPTGSGTYNNIIISTTDGTYSSALPPFSITVTGPPSSATASGTVSWTAPTRNTDGSALTDLMGVRIYYGTSAMNLNQAVQAPSTTPASCLIGSLTSGTWYFGATAYNAAGQESALSPIVGLTIP